MQLVPTHLKVPLWAEDRMGTKVVKSLHSLDLGGSHIHILNKFHS